MLTVDQALSALLANAGLLSPEQRVPLFQAEGLTLARPVESAIDVPPADNSAMDGYAFRHRDWADADTPLPLSLRITAGSAPGELAPGTAARLFTGAEVPAGADTVVMQEHCEAGAQAVRILQCPARGANIRPRAQDIRRGQRVLEEGHRLRPQDVGLLASLGIAEAPVRRRLRVAVVSTGDELREPGEALEPGQIYNSNRYLMAAQLKRWGFEVADCGVARDDPRAVREALAGAAENADVVMTSGGVSVGEEDHVKRVVEELGALELWKISIKPGKPFAFGRIGRTPFIGLPGNPVSVFVTLLIIARPYLLACQGRRLDLPLAMAVPCGFDRAEVSREEYIRVRWTPQGVIDYDNQSSGVLFSTTWGDGFVRQRAGQSISRGNPVDYLPFAAFD